MCEFTHPPQGVCQNWEIRAISWETHAFSMPPTWKILEETACQLDALRLQLDQPNCDEAGLAELRHRLSTANSLEDMVLLIGSSPEGRQTMSQVVQEYCLQELLTLSAVAGERPLVDWPNSLNKNWFSEVVRFAADHSPITLSLLLRLTVKETSCNVQPRHVVNIATVFSQIALMVDQKNNALVKLNTLQLKLHGLTDAGIDAQALMKLGQCSRNLRKDRDILAEVQEKLLILESKSRPIQLTLDNCDTKSNNCTVAFVQTESVDTSHLGTGRMSPEDTLSLFDLKLLDLNVPELQPEKEHLRSVILLALGRELAKFKPELSHWLKGKPSFKKTGILRKTISKW